jgi:hypothetical protein
MRAVGGVPDTDISVRAGLCYVTCSIKPIGCQKSFGSEIPSQTLFPTCSSCPGVDFPDWVSESSSWGIYLSRSSYNYSIHSIKFSSVYYLCSLRNLLATAVFLHTLDWFPISTPFLTYYLNHQNAKSKARYHRHPPHQADRSLPRYIYRYHPHPRAVYLHW